MPLRGFAAGGFIARRPKPFRRSVSRVIDASIYIICICPARLRVAPCLLERAFPHFYRLHASPPVPRAIPQMPIPYLSRISKANAHQPSRGVYRWRSSCRRKRQQASNGSTRAAPRVFASPFITLVKMMPKRGLMLRDDQLRACWPLASRGRELFAVDGRQV